MKIKIFGLFLLTAFLFMSFTGMVHAQEDMPEKPDTLSIMALDVDVEHYLDLAEEFEKEHGIEVEWMEYPYGEMQNQITTSITGGATFDLYMMSNSWHAELGQMGYAVPLGDVASEERLAEINERFFDQAVDFLVSHDEQWGLPNSVSTVTLYYNESILNELGYQKPPATFGELLDVSREAVDEGLASYGFYPAFLSAHEDGMVWFDIMLKIHGGQWMNEDRTEWAFNNEEGVEALTLMRDLYEEGLIPSGALETSDWDNYHHFLAGDQVFEINWGFLYESAVDEERSEIVDDVGVALIPPMIEGEDGYTVIGGGGYAISPTTRSPEWAFELLAQLHQEEFAHGVKEPGGAEAPVEALYTEEYDDMYPNEEYPLRAVFQEQVKVGGFRPSDYLTWYTEFRDEIFTPRMHEAILGDIEPEEALNEAYEEAQNILEAEGL